MAPPGSSPVLVLQPGGVRSGHGKGSCRAAAPATAGRTVRTARAAPARYRRAIPGSALRHVHAHCHLMPPCVVSRWPEELMTAEVWVRMLQITGAALGVPAAAAGTFAAYQSYFSSEVSCQKLRNDIIGIMERNVAPQTKRSLLKKDVTEFDKFCGEADPDTRIIFQAAMAEHPAEAPHAPPAASRSPPQPPRASLGVFGSPSSKEHYGSVATSRRPLAVWRPAFTTRS